MELKLITDLIIAQSILFLLLPQIYMRRRCGTVWLEAVILIGVGGLGVVSVVVFVAAMMGNYLYSENPFFILLNLVSALCAFTVLIAPRWRNDFLTKMGVKSCKDINSIRDNM